MERRAKRKTQRTRQRREAQRVFPTAMEKIVDPTDAAISAAAVKAQNNVQERESARVHVHQPALERIAGMMDAAVHAGYVKREVSAKWEFASLAARHSAMERNVAMMDAVKSAASVVETTSV